VILPVAPATMAVLGAAEPPAADGELARLRSLVAVSLLDEPDRDAPLAELTTAFTADDCIVWWRDGETMTPRTARATPDDGYRAAIATAARIAAATDATTIVPSPGGARSVIAAPLRTGPTEVAGVLAIVRDHPRRFSEAERTDLRAMATRVTRELQHLASYRRIVAEDERLRAGSLLDPLTSALTRAAFEQAVANEVAAASRRSEPLALLLVDIVGLRRINLQHGHRAGDEVLAQVANRIRSAVRGTDLIGRFGGDEVALLLINADAEPARAVADKVVARIVDTSIAVDGGEVTIAVRAVLAPIGAGERSGEASFARALGALRGARHNRVSLVPVGVDSADGDVQLDHAALGVGTTLGGTYRILHELSRGAMGVVYRGEDIGLGRQVAIKVLRSDLASDRELVGRFRTEAATLASLHHPNLVQVYALGEHAGDVYFVMELVEGQPISEVLRAAIERGEWLPLPAVAQIAAEIADALEAMHQVGLIHRDVKPGNILLDRERGRAVLVDVGVATRAGARGEGAGTPGFSAPESFTEGGESAATDVYGLAATVYAMLTGRTPFGSGQVMAVVSRQLNEPLAPPSRHRPVMTRAVDEVLAKALEPSAQRRWASASAFAVALSRALSRIGDDRGRPSAAELDHLTPSSLVASSAPADRAAALVTEVLGGDEPAAAAVPAPRGDLRGAHFRVAARGIAGRLGTAVVRSLIDGSPRLARVLSPSLPALGWEPVEAFLELLDHARPHLMPEELAALIGRATISATFARFFGANPASLPVETVLRAAPAFWGRYHTWSRMQVAAATAGVAELALEQRAAVPALCAMTGAQLAKVGELAGGGHPVVVEHTSCQARGAPGCRFIVTWDA
jgi:diguanylate cyclase (GGDEF)-like protein